MHKINLLNRLCTGLNRLCTGLPLFAIVLVITGNASATRWTDNFKFSCGGSGTCTVNIPLDGSVTLSGGSSISVRSTYVSKTIVNPDPTNPNRFFFGGLLDTTASSLDFDFHSVLENGMVFDDSLSEPIAGTISGFVTQPFATAPATVDVSFSVTGPSLEILGGTTPTGPLVFERDFTVPEDLSVESIDSNFPALGTSFSFSGTVGAILDFANYRFNGGPLTGVDSISGVTDVEPVPEPSTGLLLAGGVGVMLLRHLRRRSEKESRAGAVLRSASILSPCGGR
jgi:hypothetical protein